MRRSALENHAQLMKRQVRPERVMCTGFLLLILLGGLLLSLPWAARDGTSVGLAKAFFTATSAVCVTGLVVTDTGTTFSLFGQLVLLGLIQIGGLGFMVLTTLMMAALGRRISLHNRLVIRESLNAATLSGLVRLSLLYGLQALGIELTGAVLLSLRFVPRWGWRKGVYWGIWHSVSAFCNAGFDLYGGYQSLTGFAEEPLVLLTIAALIILGGTGFSVIDEMIRHKLRWRRFSLHARLVLLTSGGLLLGGTAAYALAEWQRPDTLGSMEGMGKRLLNAFFQSVTMRTAGFNTIDLAAMSDGAKLVSVLLMLTGANPASTGGGVKTVTVAVLLMSGWSVIRGRRDTVLFRRRLAKEDAQRALAVVLVTFVLLLLGTLALTFAESGRASFIDLLFEAASALATVGVSSAGTPTLTPLSKTVLALMMYLGRVGPLTMAMALAGRPRERRVHVRYPKEHVTIG